MIGIDTNVLVRLLVADNASQADAVRHFFAQRSGADPVFVSTVVLLEALWVLRRRFGYSRQAVLDALRQMVASAEFTFQYGERLAEVLEAGDPSSSDIADHLIASAALSAGCSHTVTFDKKAANRVPGMELLS
ncbi:PIN domain-containing protein [Chelativorans xinjiangense]|uniref:PIN domain-containing protein n=1 Tax=Chelativorans xinjiangense TaxID=2681485 RepID=UPI00135B5902|nr:type II toxin-antitoxin system VapC family toxin [Chelativorans xinjiangense]